MPETPSYQSQETSNWLTIYPAESPADHAFLRYVSSRLGDLPDTQKIVLTLADAIEQERLFGYPLKEHEVALLERVYDYIAEGISLGIDEAVSLKLRTISDSVIKNRAKHRANEKAEVEVWSFFNGDYRGTVIGESLAMREKHPYMSGKGGKWTELIVDSYVPHEAMGDKVHFLKHRIETLLRLHPDRPVVMVDIGAMYATTLLELAVVFRTEIEAGRLVLIATNIGLNRNIIEHTRKPTNGTGMYRNYDELYAQAGHLVHFLVSDVSELIGRQLMLPTGQVITLGANTVDIFHENWSISTHSHGLERDVVDLAYLAGDEGVIMSNTYDPARGGAGIGRTPHALTDTEVLFDGYFSLQQMSTARQMYEQKYLDFPVRQIPRDMHQQAKKTLLNQGYRFIDTIKHPESGDLHKLNFLFYLGSHSPPLEVFSPNGAMAEIEKAPEVHTTFRERLVGKLLGRFQK